VCSSDLAEDNRGLLLRESGRFEEATAAFRKALGAAPGYCRSWRHLVELKRFSPDDPDLARMESLYGDVRLPTNERLHLCFALGKAYDDAGNPDRAFAHYQEGNAIKRRNLDPELAREAEELRKLREIFPPDFLEASDGDTSPGLPVFVLGMPRSGTSLVEQILASHPKVHGAGELMLLRRLVRGLPGGFPENLAGLDDGELRRLGEDYLAGLRPLAPGAARITDKMPRNFQLIGLIHRILPHARIVHCRRNPLDTCLSCYTRLFRNGQAFSYDLAELGQYYRLYDELMAHWRAVLPGRLLEIDYEAVVADPKPQVEALLAHCGLDWDARCLVPHENQRAVRTASAAQVRRPLYGSSVARWRRFEAHLAPLIEALGPLADQAASAPLKVAGSS
jgi:tetratricopeptide (TPR) repeat protein